MMPFIKSRSSINFITALSFLVLLHPKISSGNEASPEKHGGFQQFNSSVYSLEAPHKNTFREAVEYPLHFFDGIKIQITNSHPKLTHVNHQVDFINRIARTNLRDWDSMDIFTFDIVLWKDLSKYFKIDFAVAVSSGALETSDKAFRNTLSISTRFRQRYDVLLFWTNLYYYPLTCTFQNSAPNRILDPFLAIGLGYTFLREETSVKFRKGKLYDRVITNYNDRSVGYKLMVGFDVKLGKFSKSLEKFGLTFTAYQIWNRMKGHANVHLTEGLKVGRQIDIDLKYKEPMDIDLTGIHFSVALSYRF
jgi:hypothetical protein